MTIGKTASEETCVGDETVGAYGALGVPYVLTLRSNLRRFQSKVWLGLAMAARPNKPEV